MKVKKKIAEWMPIATVLIIILLWWIVAIAMNAEILIPSPKTVMIKFGDLFSSNGFYLKIGNSLFRVFLSFFAALSLSIVLATLAKLSVFFERLFYPIVIMVRATPTMSVIFLCIIWFKSSISPLIVAFAVIFPTLYASVLTAVKDCDIELIEMSKIYGVPKKQQIFEMFLPSVVSRVYSDSVSALALNVKLIIAAEALAQTALSIGDSMKIAKETLETAELFAWTGVAIVLSYLLELLLRLFKFVVRRIKYAES